MIFARSNKLALGAMLLVSTPSMPVSLFFQVLICLVIAKKSGFRFNYALPIFVVVVLNVLASAILVRESWLLNFMLSLVFLLPFFSFLIINWNYNETRREKLVDATKPTLEAYIIIQIAFSLANGAYFFLKGSGGLDTNFGDYIAGTFRIPFTHSINSGTKVFSFSLLIALILYILKFHKTCKKRLLFAGAFVIFIASVNHLIISAFLAFAFIGVLRRPIQIASSLAVLIALYVALQPQNFSMIKARSALVMENFSSTSGLVTLGTKGEFIYNYMNDFSSKPMEFVFYGVGMGRYASRAAMYLSGDFADFPIESVSKYTKTSVMPLYEYYKTRPPYLAGAFYYPYNSLFSFLAEFGLVPGVLIIIFLMKRIMSVAGVGKQYLLGFFIFLLLASCIDHYFEYSAAWVLLLIILSVPRLGKLDVKYHS